MFLDGQWLKLFIEKINHDVIFSEIAGMFEGNILFEVLPSEELTPRKYVCLEFKRGVCKSGFFAESPDKVKATLVISAPYTSWKGIATGETELMKGIFSGEFNISGSKETLRALWKNYLRVLHELGRIIREVSSKTKG
jgi:hypothetical protein